MKLDVALKTAEALVEYLRPACRKIVIAGSVSRLVADVGDIEIIAVPDDTQVPRGKVEFGKPAPPVYKTLLDKMVDEMRISGDIRIDANGDRYKKLWLKYAGIQVDLFINIPPSQWGVQSLIRTGPSEFSHWVVANKRLGGALPNGYFVKHQVVWIESEIPKIAMPKNADKAVALLSDDNHLSMPEEIDFFRFLGMEWIEPKERRASWTR